MWTSNHTKLAIIAAKMHPKYYELKFLCANMKLLGSKPSKKKWFESWPNKNNNEELEQQQDSALHAQSNNNKWIKTEWCRQTWFKKTLNHIDLTSAPVQPHWQWKNMNRVRMEKINKTCQSENEETQRNLTDNKVQLLERMKNSDYQIM